jgi:hypothetical protein
MANMGRYGAYGFDLTATVDAGLYGRKFRDRNSTGGG